MRYHTAHYDKQTRAEINRRFGQPVPRVPPVPPMGQDLLEWFWDLSAARTYSDGSPDPLSFLELDAWQRVRGIRLREIEADILVSLDRTYRAALAHELKYSEERRREAIQRENERRDGNPKGPTP